MCAGLAGAGMRGRRGGAGGNGCVVARPELVGERIRRKGRERETGHTRESVGGEGRGARKKEEKIKNMLNEMRGRRGWKARGDV